MHPGDLPEGRETGFPDQRYRRGLEAAEELAGHGAVQTLLEDLQPISPATSRLLIETVFGSLHRLPGLDHRERELVTLTTLAVLGDTEKELVIHLAIANRIGVPPASVVAAFTHISAYAGFPRTLNALAVAKRFYADQGILPLQEQ
jgi:4-carboxymuconolactone decarboxylase